MLTLVGTLHGQLLAHCALQLASCTAGCPEAATERAACKTGAEGAVCRRKLLKAFHNEKKQQFDISKVPDIYDSAKYDAIHNRGGTIITFSRAGGTVVSNATGKTECN